MSLYWDDVYELVSVWYSSHVVFNLYKVIIVSNYCFLNNAFICCFNTLLSEKPVVHMQWTTCRILAFTINRCTTDCSLPLYVWVVHVYRASRQWGSWTEAPAAVCSVWSVGQEGNMYCWRKLTVGVPFLSASPSALISPSVPFNFSLLAKAFFLFHLVCTSVRLQCKQRMKYKTWLYDFLNSQFDQLTSKYIPPACLPVFGSVCSRQTFLC